MTVYPTDAAGRLTGLGELQLAAHRLARLAGWPFRSRRRLLTVLVVVGLVVLGAVQNANADELIPGPPLAPDDPGQQNVFERFGLSSYNLTIWPDVNNDGVSAAPLYIMNAIETGMMWLGMAIVRGAMTAMQWMLGLNLYSDNYDSVNAAVSATSGRILTPLIATVLVIAAGTAYARAKREGGGTVFNDVTWIVAGGVFALGFAAFPGTIIDGADSVRTLLSNQVISAYGASTDPGASPVDYPVPNYTVAPACGEAGCQPQRTAIALRKLSDTMWNGYVVTPWCYLQFESMSVCKELGTTVLERGDAYNEIEELVTDGGKYENKQEGLYPAFEKHDKWIRGEDYGRFGATLVFLVMSVPIALLLLALVVYGLMAIIGILLLVVVGPFFLMMWVIPGVPRRMGMQWLQMLIGVMIQSVIITLTLGAVATVTSILNSQIGTYGYFMTALFNIVMLVVAFRLRGQMESFTGANLSATSSSPISSRTAWRALGAAKSAGAGIAGRIPGATAAAGRGAAGVGRAGVAGAKVSGRAAAELGRRTYPHLPPPMQRTVSGTFDKAAAVSGKATSMTESAQQRVASIRKATAPFVTAGAGSAPVVGRRGNAASGNGSASTGGTSVGRPTPAAPSRTTPPAGPAPVGGSDAGRPAAGKPHQPPKAERLRRPAPPKMPPPMKLTPPRVTRPTSPPVNPVQERPRRRGGSQ